MLTGPGLAGLAVILAVGVATAPGDARAQGGTSTVYRCADGQYSQTPCPGGRLLDTGPAPTAQQQREARAAAATEARLAEQLRQERHARERAAVGQAPARIGPPVDDGRRVKPPRAPKAGAERSTARPKPPKAVKPPKASQASSTPRDARRDGRRDGPRDAARQD